MVKIPDSKEDFYRNISKFICKGIELEVSSSPFGCKEGYSKIYIRRKDIHHDSIELYKFYDKFHFPMPKEYSKCRQDSEIKLLKQEIKSILKSMMNDKNDKNKFVTNN